jgi:hypothetical protein
MAVKKTKNAKVIDATNVPQLLQLGDRVKIRNSGGTTARIVELRGPLGPGGVQIYRVRIRRKPKPTYVEVREDQLVAIPAEK